MQAIADLLDEDAVALDVVDDAFSLPKSYAIIKESGACLLPMATNGPLYQITLMFDDGGIFVRPPQRTVALRQISTGRRGCA